MTYTQLQIDLLTHLGTDPLQEPVPFEDIPKQLSATLVELEGMGLVAFEDGAASLTGDGATAYAIIESGVQEPAQATPELEELKKPSIESENAAGEKVTISPTQAMSTQLRQSAVQFLKQLSPEDYDEYKKRKFEGVEQGDRPSLEQSKAAYLWAFGRFLDLTYTESGV